MFEEGTDRGPPGNLRGWLSEIYIPVLLEATPTALESLIARLGGRATIDDPIFGRASGLPALVRYVNDASAWLTERAAKYEQVAFTTGPDRDICEGVLTLTIDGKVVHVPVAVLVERRKSREVELRLYYSTQPIHGTPALRSPLVARDDELVLPTCIAEHFDALRRGDVKGLLDAFESQGTLRDSRGLAHAKDGDLGAFYERLFGANAGSGLDVLKGSAADDGRTCALEYTLVKVGSHPIAPQAALAVYERGDSGLLKSLRIYDDLYDEHR